MSASKTAYSIGVGGQQGYINIGGWNTTLTDVSTTPGEVCGTVRFEGANKYMYVCNGSQSAARGAFVQVSTMTTDGGGTRIPPLRMTSVPYTVCTSAGRAFGMWVPTQISTNEYGWILRQGITTCYIQTNSAVVAGNMFAPSTASADCWATTASNSGQAFALEACATATGVASGTGQGFLAFVNLEASIGHL
jgi:hypothetical protein